jgi:hypothetical protein
LIYDANASNSALSSPHRINKIFILDFAQGHGFRNDLFQMVADMKPGFIRFPGMHNKAIQIETSQTWNSNNISYILYALFLF